MVSTYKEAPLDAGGVSIVFNMVNPLTGLPIGCSANQPAATCATPIRLTPRLAAMLITNSATVNAEEPFGHFVSGSTKRFIEPLTEDPEFEALNPGFQPPAICAVKKKKNVCTDYVEEPVLRAEQTDDTFILTQWIADDYDARRFLAGQDPCGAQLNQDWDSVAYPATEFMELAESSSGTTPDSDSYYPETGTQNVLQSLLYGIPVGGPPPSPGSPKSWLPAPTDNYAFFGVVDWVSAAPVRFPERAADRGQPRLEPAPAVRHRERRGQLHARHQRVGDRIRGRQRRRPRRGLPDHETGRPRVPPASGDDHRSRRVPPRQDRLRR